LTSSAKVAPGSAGVLAGADKGITIGAANIAVLASNQGTDPESIAGEDAGAPRNFDRWTASSAESTCHLVFCRHLLREIPAGTLAFPELGCL